VVVALAHEAGERGVVGQEREADRDGHRTEDEVEEHARQIGSAGTLP